MHCTRHCFQRSAKEKDQSRSASSLICNIKARFVHIKMKEPFELATMVGSKFKHVCYVTNIEKEWAENLLEATVENDALVHHTVDNAMSARDDIAELFICNIFGQLVYASGATSRSSTKMSHIKVEEYLSSPALPHSENSMLWQQSLGKVRFLAKVKAGVQKCRCRVRYCLPYVN